MGGGLDEHVSEQIASIEQSLARVDEMFGNLDSVNYDQVVKNMSSLDRAKYDLTNLYAINSLFWMYYRSFGLDPKEVPIKEELDRIRRQMQRASEIANKSKMPKIDKGAAHRMVRSGLWQPKSNTSTSRTNDESGEFEENWDEDEPMETDKGVGRKRKFDENEQESEESGEEFEEINGTNEKEITSTSSSEEEDQS